MTYLLRANEQDQTEAIDKFIELIRPQLEDRVWYLDPIAFLAWFYNLRSLHDPVATSDNTRSDMRTILCLEPFKRQGFDPSAKVLHYRTPSADRVTPTSTDVNPHSTAQDPHAGVDRETVSPAPSTTHIGVSANETGSGNDQLPSPISQTRPRDQTHKRARLNQDIESDERTPPPAVPPNQPQRDAQESSPYAFRSMNEGPLSRGSCHRSIGSTTLPPISSWCDFDTPDVADLPPAAETVSRTLFHDIDLERIDTAGQDLCDMIGGWNDADLEDWGHLLDENGNLFEHLFDAAERF